MALTKASLIDLNANELILDLDADTSITADTDDTIHFKIGGTDRVTIAGSALSPASSDGSSLGTTALEWSDLFLADGAVINFGDDQDVSLTHVADTGLLLSSTDQLQFGDSGTYIHQSADGVLDLVSDTEIEINATTIDMNGALEVSGTISSGGVITATGFTIGSAAILEAELELLDGLTLGTAIASKVVTTDANIDTTGQRNLTITGELDAATLDISGNADIDGTTNLDVVDIDGATQIDATVTVGVDDTGYDVKFFGATSGAYMLWDESVDDLILAGASRVVVPDGQLVLGSTAVTSTAAELNLLDGVSGLVQADLTKLAAVDSTAAELNLLNGVSGLVQADLTKLAAVDSTATELNIVDGNTTVGTTAVADGDGIVTNDGGTMRQTTVQTFATYFGSEITAMSNLVTTGALNSGSITSGFGNIDNGASNITSGGLLKLDVDADANDVTGDSATGRLTLGAGEDLNLYHGGTDSYIVNDTGDLIIKNGASDEDILFQGNDGGGAITALTLDMSAAGAAGFNGVVTANAGVVVDNITIDGTEIDLSSGDLTIDVAGDIILDADGGDIKFADAGTVFGTIKNSSSDFKIDIDVQDKDFIVTGNDGGSAITALTLDMSAGGTATFNSNINIAGDDTKLKFGANSEIELTHYHNVGLILKNTNDGAAGVPHFILQSGDTDIAANDYLGTIQFQAPDERTGTDAILIAAAIDARAEGNFAADNNATSLHFRTGASETATDKLQITSDGRGLSQFTAKAWVNFNGTDMSVRDSHNVSSLDDNGTGQYDVNFANNLANSDFVSLGNSTKSGGSASASNSSVSYIGEGRSGSYFTIETYRADGLTARDSTFINAAAFGD